MFTFDVLYDGKLQIVLVALLLHSPEIYSSYKMEIHVIPPKNNTTPKTGIGVWK